MADRADAPLIPTDVKLHQASRILELVFPNGRQFRLPYEFLVRYVLKGGFLDGKTGLTYALLSSYYVWLKYAKLNDLENVR